VAIAMNRRREAGLKTSPNPSARARQVASPNARFNRLNIAKSHMNQNPHASFNRSNLPFTKQNAIQRRMQGQNPDLPSGGATGITSLAAKKKLLQAHPALARRLQTGSRPVMTTNRPAGRSRLPDFASMKSGDLEELKRLLSHGRAKPKKPKKTGPGPHPSARAYERANENARFKRGLTNPNTRREVLDRMRAKRKKHQARKGLHRLNKRGVYPGPRGTQS
jgi:hypothetical protein